MPSRREVFQFTPLREGRRITKIKVTSSLNYFNSRPSARGDALRTRRDACERISIHAPPRGATDTRSTPPPCSAFQFTPLREGRLDPSKLTANRKLISIHAPPRGATQWIPQSNRSYYFNSRPSARGDFADVAAATAAAEFQFTPLREGRRGKSAHLPCCGNFNSRPSARGDCQPSRLIIDLFTFQFTPLREGRRGTGCGKLKQSIFQFTPLREGRRIFDT